MVAAFLIRGRAIGSQRALGAVLTLVSAACAATDYNLDAGGDSSSIGGRAATFGSAGRSGTPTAIGSAARAGITSSSSAPNVPSPTAGAPGQFVPTGELAGAGNVSFSTVILPPLQAGAGSTFGSSSSVPAVGGLSSTVGTSNASLGGSAVNPAGGAPGAGGTIGRGGTAPTNSQVSGGAATTRVEVTGGTTNRTTATPGPSGGTKAAGGSVGSPASGGSSAAVPGGSTGSGGTTSSSVVFSGGTPGAGGIAASGGVISSGGSVGAGGKYDASGTVGVGGSSAASGSSAANPFCNTYVDLGTLPNAQYQLNPLPTAATCYRFTFSSSGQKFQGIQMSNCDSRTATINGTASGCTPATSCSVSVVVARASDGYFYLSYSAATTKYCSSSWWWN